MIRLGHKFKKGPSKSLPNCFQIRRLELVIWTFEQIDELRQAASMNSYVLYNLSR